MVKYTMIHDDLWIGSEGMMMTPARVVFSPISSYKSIYKSYRNLSNYEKTKGFSFGLFE